MTPLVYASHSSHSSRSSSPRKKPQSFAASLAETAIRILNPKPAAPKTDDYRILEAPTSPRATRSKVAKKKKKGTKTEKDDRKKMLSSPPQQQRTLQ